MITNTEKSRHMLEKNAVILWLNYCKLENDRYIMKKQYEEGRRPIRMQLCSLCMKTKKTTDNICIGDRYA